MSTLVYAALSERRVRLRDAPQATREPERLSSLIDAVAGLVPAEVLSAHAIILGFTTETNGTSTTITAPAVLQAAFYTLIGLSILLYVVGRVRSKTWEKLDYGRMFVPPLAFVAWTMLQRSTAFDALPGGLDMPWRLFIGVIGAFVIGAGAYLLSMPTAPTPRARTTTGARRAAPKP
jgi:hypothetical protein